MENTENEPFRLIATGEAKKCHASDLLDDDTDHAGDLNETNYMTSDEVELDEIHHAKSKANKVLASPAPKNEERPAATNTIPRTGDVIQQKADERRIHHAQAKHDLKAWKLIATLIALCVGTLVMQAVVMYVSYYYDLISPCLSGSGSDMNMPSTDPDAKEKAPHPFGTFQFKNNTDYIPPEYEFTETLMHVLFGFIY